MPHIMALCAWLKGNGHTALGIGCQDGMSERDSTMRLWRAFMREVCGHWMRLSATSHYFCDARMNVLGATHATR